MSFDNPRVLGFLFLFVVFIPVAIVRYRKNREKVTFLAAAALPDERNFLLAEVRLRMIISDIFFLLFAGFRLMHGAIKKRLSDDSLFRMSSDINVMI